jgi:hypothetical protein
MRGTRLRRAEAGFTLVEIMIALGIFMLVILAIYSTWSAVLRASKSGLEAAATAQRSRVAVHAIEDSLTCATMFSANPRYYSFVADADPGGEFSIVTFTSHLPMSFPGSGLFGDQAVRRVSFFVEADPVYRRRLVMMQTPLMQQAVDNPQGYPLVLARGVTAFTLEFWDPREADWVIDPPPTNQLPPIVRFTLGLSQSSDPSAPPEVVTRIVKIASSAVVPTVQAPVLPPGGAPFVPPAVGPGATPFGAPTALLLPGSTGLSAGNSIAQAAAYPFGAPMSHGMPFNFVPGGPAPP